MTLPTEEVYSLKYARKFLRDLAGMKLMDIRKNARSIRTDAIARLRHYPADYIIDRMWNDRLEREE